MRAKNGGGQYGVLHGTTMARNKVQARTKRSAPPELLVRVSSSSTSILKLHYHGLNLNLDTAGVYTVTGLSVAMSFRRYKEQSRKHIAVSINVAQEHI